ncbi:YqeB family protein [Bacillus cereus group sp. MYBK79-1]|uniref:YqeB family protein n=1 Tax=unclassified Bacillus cereus group TaxID=2750818 RepID=UPI003F7B181A
MKNTSVIGLGFLEKLLAIVSPILLGIIGYFSPKLIGIIKSIPLFSDSKIIELLNSINPFWLPIILMFIGVIAGILFSLIIYSDALKMKINSEIIHISKGDQEKQITKAKVKAVFVEKRQVVVIDHKDREWLRETSDINPNKIKDTFLLHGFQWVEQDPYKEDYSLWKLEDEQFSKSVNTILYERRNALREGNSKKNKHLRKDLHELGVFVKDEGEDQYVRSIKE